MSKRKERNVVIGPWVSEMDSAIQEALTSEEIIVWKFYKKLETLKIEAQKMGLAKTSQLIEIAEQSAFRHMLSLYTKEAETD